MAESEAHSRSEAELRGGRPGSRAHGEFDEGFECSHADHDDGTHATATEEPGDHCSATVDPAKLLEIVRRWCPAAPVEFPITLVKSLIEAAASGASGELRLGLLEDFVFGLAAQLCSNSQKIGKLKKETVRMAADPLRRPKLRPGHPAELARAALAAVQRAPDQVLSVEKIHTALRRVKPKIRQTSTYALVKRMTDCGWLERVDAGIYGLPGRSRKPYEPRTLQLLRIVYTAPGHQMGTGQAVVILDWSPKLLSATASELCSRNLLKSEKRVLIVPREIVDKLARGEGVPIAPGKVFYARAGGPPVDHSAFVTLRPERPHVDLAELESEYLHISSLFPEEQKVARKDLVARGVDEKVIDLGVKHARAAKGLPADVRKAIKAASKAGCKQAYQDKMIEEPDAQDNRDVLARKMMDEFQLTWEEVRTCRKDALNGKDWGKKPGRPRKSEASAPVEKTSLNRLGFRSQNPV